MDRDITTSAVNAHASATMNSVFILGKSFAGKTTLAKNLANILHCDILPIGEILRYTFPPQRILNWDISQAEIFEIIIRKSSQMGTNLLLVDNFPINDQQFKSWILCFDLPVIVLHLDIEDISDRKLQRKRLDDFDANFQKRELKYNKETVPLLDYLSKRVPVVKLDATKSPEQLSREAADAIRTSFEKLNINFQDKSVVNFKSNSSKIPKRISPFSGGIDIVLPNPVSIPPYKTEKFSIFVSVELGPRTVGIILPKSDICAKNIILHQTTIYSFSSDIELVVTNLNPEPTFLDAGIAVGQLLVLPIFCPEIKHEFHH